MSERVPVRILTPDEYLARQRRRAAIIRRNLWVLRFCWTCIGVDGAWLLFVNHRGHDWSVVALVVVMGALGITMVWLADATRCLESK